MAWRGIAWQVLSELTVEYETVPGWKQSLAQCRDFEDLPAAAQVTNFGKKGARIEAIRQACVGGTVQVKG